MSNATYDLVWRETMAELNEQVHIEDNTLNVAEGDEPPPPPPQATIMEAFQHFACLYIKYVQIFKRLEMCYDAMVHPQKRIDVKMVLELVIRRVLELKHELVKWNPPNADMRFPPPAPEQAFPWDYVNLDDILVDLKLSPDTLDIAVPRYFKQDGAVEITARDTLVKGYIKLRHNIADGLPLDDKEDPDSAAGEMTLDMALEIIQRNERGRQGKQRALLLKELREEEKKRRIYDATDQLEMDPEIAAANIQRLFRGSAARRRARQEREDEMIYIGMKPAESTLDELQRELDIAYQKRKQEQTDNRDAYEEALEDLKDVVLEEEGPEMRESLREERTLWVTDQIAQDKFPEDLEAFYLLKNPPSEEKPLTEEEGGKKGKGKDAKGKGDKEDKGKGKEKGGKGGKGGKGKKGGKGGGGDPDEPPELPPPLQGKSELAEKIFAEVKHFSGVWEDRDESDNFAQKHDVSLAKDKIRPSVTEEIRKQVDEMLLMNLQKIKMQVAKQAEKKGGKKGGKGGGKKGGKGGKKGGKKGKGDKKGKKKGLPGDKISELKNMDTDQMLSLLVENRLISTVAPRRVSDFVGDFNYLGMIHQHTERREGQWIPQDPSMAQLRQLVTEYCILPVGSKQVKASLKPEHNLKAVMLYGPGGAGKTMMVEAIASELGALVINLSPSRLKGLFPGKTGPTKAVHMAFEVAKDVSMAPVVIYVDECEQMFAAGGKKGKGADKEGAARFKKDMITYKNQALQPEDRVIIVGCTSKPEAGDAKEFKNFFQKFLYVPAPDYASRLMLWHHFIRERLEQGSRGHSVQIGSTVDLSTLAHVSEGYTAGSIYRSVKTTLTPRRVHRIAKRPLLSSEFLGVLAQQQQLLVKNVQVYQDFTAKITGLEERRKLIKDAKASEGGADEKGGKGKANKGGGGKKKKKARTKFSANRQREQRRKRAVCVLGEPPPTLTTGAECTRSSLCSAARIERGSSNLLLHEIFLPPRRRDGCGLGTGFALRPDEVHGAPSRLRSGLTVARPRRKGAAALRV